MARLLTMMAAAALLTACGDEEVGRGIGRPSFEVPPAAETRPIVVREVFVADPVEANRFVEVQNVGLEPAELNDLTLTGGDAEVSLSSEATLAPSERRVLPAPAGLLPHLGEVGLVADGVVYAYFPWGGSVPSELGAQAGVQGLVTPGFYVPAGYPMPIGTAVVLTDAGAGCAAPTPGSETTALTTCPIDRTALVLTELLPALAPEVGTWVELENRTAAPLSLYGVRICQPPHCLTLSRGATLEAAEIALVHIGSFVPDELAFPSAERLSAAGELALLAPGAPGYTDPAAYLAYVRYGTVLPVTEAAAVTAGVWAAGEAVELVPRVPLESLSRLPALTDGAAAWAPAAPTPKAVNADIGPSTDIWTSCSYARPWLESPAPPAVVAELRASNETPGRIVVRQRGATVATDLVFELTTVTGVAATETTEAQFHVDLGQGGELVISLGPSGDGCGPGYCWDVELPIAGELTVRDASTDAIQQYLAWGSLADVVTGATDSTPRAQVDAAITANAWPAAPCSLGALPPGARVTLQQGAAALSPPDYLVTIE